MVEINGLLNRRTTLKLYRGFESLPHRKALISQGFFLMYYLNILYSEKILQFYCRQTNNINSRLQQHNSGETVSNKHGISWILIGYIEFKTRSEAMKLKKQTKKRGIKRWVIEHKNELIKVS